MVDVPSPKPDYRELFEASPDVLLVLLPDPPRFTMVAATDARLRATHTTREDTLGRGLFEIFPDNPDDPAATGMNNLRASLDRVVATRAADTMAVQKYDIRGPDGTFQVKYWSPKNIPVLTAVGEIQYILHRVEDVTELVQASELGQELRDRTQEMEREVITRSRELAAANNSLRDANAKLGELDRAKTAFFSNVSHEFRTPLTLILGLVERALEGGDALVAQDLDLVHRNAVRLLNLVNSLLDFSRIEAGRLEMAFSAVDLSLATRGLVSAFHSLFDEAGLTLTIDCPPLAEPVYVDSTQWERVVMNLVSNAFKFTFEGGVTVSLRLQESCVELTVQDTGTGIPEHELQRIFERFHRVEGARGRSFEGSGIGLAMVHDIVSQHGGSVRVTSKLGLGTTFVVSLPRGCAHLPRERIATGGTPESQDGRDGRDGRSAAPVVEARQWLRPRAHDEGEEEDRVASDSGGPAGRILVADDSPDMREYFHKLLSPHWQVELVPNGRAALEAAIADPPDLVLSDVMMPEMNGTELLQALRAHPSTNCVPVILISARAGEEARLSGLETGADDYIIKPFAARELVTRVRTHLQMAGVRRAATESARLLAETKASLLARLEQEHTALRSAHEELKRTQAQLIQSAKMASLGELVAGVAHEINNPLAFGMSHLDTVQRSLRVLSDQVDMGVSPEAVVAWDRAQNRLEETRMALRRIGELVRQLRTFSRLDEGERKRIDLHESIASVLTILGYRLGQRIQVTTQIGAPRQIDCYAGLFNQAVMNLLSNAIDAIEGEGTIVVATTMVGDWFELTVSDTGCGLPDAVRERAFEPFFTTKPVGEGTGLGLAITYSIAKRHGGQVTLTPRAGGGTVATLRFPITT